MDSLVENGWNVCEVPVEEKSLKRLRKCFFKGKYFLAEQLALKILEKALDYVGLNSDETEHSYKKPRYDPGNTYYDGFPTDDAPSDEEDNYDEYEDYLDDWWLRGEDPPAFSD